jgi:phosphate-selective porin OprO/OprP
MAIAAGLLACCGATARAQTTVSPSANVAGNDAATGNVVERLAAQEARLRAQEARLEQQEARLREQEARLRQQEAQLRQQAQRLEQPVAPTAPLTSADVGRAPPLFGFSNEGFFIGKPDIFQVRLRGLVQADARAYFDTAAAPLPDQFVIRRARPIFEGTIGDFVDFRLVPDFGQGQALIQDAYVDLRPWRFLSLRAGKFKTPLGLERLQYDALLAFMERGLPSDLVPDRDVGAVLLGDIAGGIFQYQLGVFDGAPDNASVDSDTNDGKDFAARVFFHPLRGLRRDFVRNLGVGFGATYGKQHGTVVVPGLPVYKTTGQNTFFSYYFDPTGAKTTVIAISDRYRFSPQLYWYAGPLGLLAEYVYSATTVTTDPTFTQPRKTLEHQAWQVETQVVLTGERASYNGVRPKRPFNLRRRQFGAVELAARYGELRVDPETFPTYADPTRSAQQALEWGVGVNWYLLDPVKIVVDFERTTFKGGAGVRGDRRPENALLARVQVGF